VSGRLEQKTIIMKKFMLIFFGESYSNQDFSPEEMQRRMQQWGKWTEKMIKEGVYVDGKGLLGNSRTLTSAEGKAKDGPYLDVKETVGGYYIVKVKDMDAAIEIARDYPDFDLTGGVEISECMPEVEG